MVTGRCGQGREQTRGVVWCLSVLRGGRISLLLGNWDAPSSGADGVCASDRRSIALEDYGAQWRERFLHDVLPAASRSASAGLRLTPAFSLTLPRECSTESQHMSGALIIRVRLCLGSDPLMPFPS